MREGVERGEPGWNEWEQTRLRLFHEEGRVCFDLFAPLTADIFSRSRRIRNRVASRYPLVLVDETQDTGNDQWACARALAEKSQLVCLADLDQLISDHLPEESGRIVIHKTSQYQPEEEAGFRKAAAARVPVADLIWLRSTAFRLIRKGT